MAQDGLDGYLFDALSMGASDLHVTAGMPPVARVDGEIRALPGPPLAPGAARCLIYGVLPDDARRRLEEDRELDLAYSPAPEARFRLNVFFQRDAVAAAFRAVPNEVRSLRDLGLPGAVEEMARRPRGLVLLTGPTGSGKSTTLAAMIDAINETRRAHIVSVEDPIEFVHRHKRSIVSQREVGRDTKSFARALRSALRQDPDVVLVGEMRDLETISLALTAAETGHLVLASLHTRDAPQAVDRVVDVFPPHGQPQVRAQLAGALQGVVSQALLPRLDKGGGRVLACEVLVPTPGVRNLIREGKTHQIHSAMQAGARFGMRTMDAALADLARRGLVAPEEAESRSDNPEELRRLGASHSTGSRAAFGG